MVRGVWRVVCGVWYMVRGAWCVVDGACVRYVAHGAWCMGRGECVWCGGKSYLVAEPSTAGVDHHAYLPNPLQPLQETNRRRETEVTGTITTGMYRVMYRVILQDNVLGNALANIHGSVRVR